MLLWQTHRKSQKTAKNTASADQQKQLDRLQQLTGQLAKDREAVSNAVAQYGWDSNEADAAQQHLLEDRWEYRNLRRLLQNEEVNLPVMGDAIGGNCCNHDGHHCCEHGNGNRDCCSGGRHCVGHHHDCCGDHGS